MNTFLNSIILTAIQRKTAGHCRKATDATGPASPKLAEWFGLDYDNRFNIFVLDLNITAFACLFDGYLTVVEVVTISRDLL